MGVTPTGTTLSEMAAALRRLSEDVTYVCERGEPSAEMLAGAPILHCWAPGLIGPTNCLVGRVANHPRLGDRPLIHTSELFVIDPVAGWARTWSRFYLLGRPRDDDRVVGHA